MMPPAPLLLVPGNFAESRPCVMSLMAKDAPLLKLSLSRRSGVTPLLSGWTSISLKEELRLGGAGAFFFFFLMRLRKPLPRVLSLSLGSKRSSSFRLLSRRGRSFLGSIGDDTAASNSTGSEEEPKTNKESSVIQKNKMRSLIIKLQLQHTFTDRKNKQTMENTVQER